MTEHKRPTRSQTVRVRQTFQPSSAVKTSLSVLCRETNASLRLAECFRCPEFGWLEVEPSNDRFVLSCGRGTAHDVRRDEEEPHPMWEPLEKILDEPLSKIMTSKVYCVAKDTPIEVLAMLFIEHSVSAAPVVAEDGRPLGLVSKTDLLRALFGREQTPPSGASWLQHDEDSTAERLLRFAAAGGVAEGTAENLMTPDPVTLEESAAVRRAIDLMSDQRIHHVIITSSEGLVVGIYSTLDVVDLIARPNQTPKPRSP